MSQLADLRKVFKAAPGKYGITQEQAAELFLEVLDAQEWDALSVQCLEPDSSRDQAIAMGFLFGSEE